MNLIKKRKSMGLTQFDVEKITGIDSATLSLYENNLRTPTVVNAKKLGVLYGIPWSKFFDEENSNDKGRTRRKTSRKD